MRRRRYRGIRRDDWMSRLRAPGRIVLGVVVVTSLTWGTVAVGTRTSTHADVPARAENLQTGHTTSGASGDDASVHPAVPDASPSPDVSRSPDVSSRPAPALSPGTPADFAVTLSASSGLVGAGSLVRFTVRTTVVAGTPGPLTLAVTGLPASASALVTPNPAGADTTASVTITTSTGTPPGTYPVAISATAGVASHRARYALTVNPVPVIVDGDFESGLSGWTSSGPASTVDHPVHGGGAAVRLGTTSASKTTTLSQDVTGTGQISLWYRMVCNDDVTNDWFDARVADLTTGGTVDLVGRTCETAGSWRQATATLTPGDRYRIVLENHDDDWADDPSYTFVDDVALT